MPRTPTLRLLKRNAVRSTLFNVLFYILTAIACVVCLPTLALPRRYFMGVVYSFVRSVYLLERVILGLGLEVRGDENLPADGAYIIAAKHQSAYETLKLHLLFKDPAVILKEELLSIPLWGLYLKKSDPIAIDRSNPERAIASIQEGARRVAAQGRPIVIFPQGTRVDVRQSADKRPYKIGVARVQEATGLPIIPMAINAGMFWPKNGWFKSSGRAVFTFLPAVDAGKDRKELLTTLQSAIEGESLSLMNEARECEVSRSGKAGRITAGVLGLSALMLFGLYSFAWFETAKQTKVEYVSILEEMTGGRQTYAPPRVTGYPLKMRLYVAQETLQNNRGALSINDLRVEGWPLPFMPIEVHTGEITAQYFKWRAPLVFDSLNGAFTLQGTKVHLVDAILEKAAFKTHLAGDINMQAQPAPLIDLMVTFERPEPLLKALGESGIVEPQMAQFIGAGLSSFKDDDGLIHVPVYQRNLTLFVGPLPVMMFKDTSPLDANSFDADLGVRLHPIP